MPDESHMTDEMVKIGMRNNASDQRRIQMLHDLSVEQGAVCAPQPMDPGMMPISKSVDPDQLIAFGGEVKAIGPGKLGGYLVRFSSESDPDLTGEYFTKDTDLGEPSKFPLMYQHGFDSVIGKRRIGTVTVTKDDVGLWAEAQINLRDEYEKAIQALGDAGKLGYSSGSASHAIDKVPGKSASWIKQWYIAEASLTPTPAEFRNSVVPLKSLIPPDSGMTAGEKVTVQEVTTKEKADMEAQEFKALLDENNKSLTAVIEEKAAAAATKAVEEFAKKLPEVKTAVNVEVVKDEADQPFKSTGEFFMAVKNAALAPYAIDPRLKGLKVSDNEMKATGAQEAVPSQGGFLVPQQTAAGILEKTFNTGTLLSLFPRDPVTGNNMTYNAVDETSRADGSRHGGVQGYWGGEGGTKTGSKGKFKQIELKLRKVYALCVATDELLEDANALGAWINRVAPDELRFKVEDAIINGVGGFQPLGILQSPALKSATRTDASEIDATDIMRMWAARYAGVNDYVWLGNQAIFPQLATMTLGNFPVFMGAGGVSNLPYSQLLGRPYYDIEYAPNLGTAGDLMLVSPSQYQMIEKSGGIQVASSIHVYFTTDESAFRFVYRCDGAPIWTSALTCKDGTNTVSPFVVLGATT